MPHDRRHDRQTDRKTERKTERKKAEIKARRKERKAARATASSAPAGGPPMSRTSAGARPSRPSPPPRPTSAVASGSARSRPSVAGAASAPAPGGDENIAAAATRPAAKAVAIAGTGVAANAVASTAVNAVAGTVAGTVAILGRPNVGKSTLLNQIVGQKLAIVSPKPQTTRNRILGIWNGPEGQIVFVDTPGVHNARGALHRFMVEEALGVVSGVEAALLVVEPPESAAAVKVTTAERQILDVLRQSGKPVVLAINKIDTFKDKPALFPVLKAWHEIAPFAALVPVSARKGSGVAGLVVELTKLLPLGGPLFDADMLTDRTERFLTGELIREQLFLGLRQELPYATAVMVENWEERPDRQDVVIDAVIVVERESQKSIVVGKGGTMIRDLGTRARAEVTTLLGRPAHLRLFVKVAPEWTSSPDGIAAMGYDR